ncbi:hypothetical protein AB6A40_007236 [Gnathostoma spinigerum]|uniref:CX domain-containing protein n=1 Tax=Gnathostoma spinigerum TaxID=75299 RepID=A0ABD6EVC7_9BILA
MTLRCKRCLLNESSVIVLYCGVLIVRWHPLAMSTSNIFHLPIFLTIFYLLTTVLSSLSYSEEEAINKVRSLTGSPVALGDNRTNELILKLVTQRYLDGFFPWRVKAFNDRVFLPAYRRSYWLGMRYYYMDNLHYLPTRETCVYHMNTTERGRLQYEDGLPIRNIVYQCQRFAQICCGLDCCTNPRFLNPKRADSGRPYPWDYSSSNASFKSRSLFVILCALSMTFSIHQTHYAK